MKNKKKKKTKMKLWSLVSQKQLEPFAYIDSPTWQASLQQIWLNLGKISRSYIGVKIKVCFF